MLFLWRLPEAKHKDQFYWFGEQNPFCAAFQFETWVKFILFILLEINPKVNLFSRFSVLEIQKVRIQKVWISINVI